MICLEDLIQAKLENEEKIAELNAENRVFDKLIAMENAKVVENQSCEEVVDGVEQQVDGSY